MESGELIERRAPQGSQPKAQHRERAASESAADLREESGSRWRLWDRLKTAISSEHPAVTAPAKSVKPSDGSSPLDHERARQLLVAERSSLLPAADANALSAHLLTCDQCYRFAQDLAARPRQ